MIPQHCIVSFFCRLASRDCAPRVSKAGEGINSSNTSKWFVIKDFSNHCKPHFSFTVWNLLQSIKILFSSCFYPQTQEFLSSTGNVLNGGLGKNIFQTFESPYQLCITWYVRYKRLENYFYRKKNYNHYNNSKYFPVN